MRTLLALARRFSGLFRRAATERDLNDEIRAHLSLLVDENIRRGMTADEARAAALRSFGGVEQVKESYRDQKGLPVVEDAWWDLRYTIRVLRRNPGFAAVFILSLGLGIGANTAIFSVVDAVLLRPLPYAEPDRLVYIWSSQVTRGIPQSTVSYPDFGDWREQAISFSAMAARMRGTFTVQAGGEPFQATGEIVTAAFFDVLGVKPVAGRTFANGEDQPGHNRLVVLAEAAARELFGSAQAAAGASLLLNRQPYTVIGVMPAALSSVNPRVRLWVPATFQLGEEARNDRFLEVIARLKPGVDSGAAAAEMETIAGRLAAQHPAENRGVSAYLVPARAQVVGRAKPSLLMLLGAVVLVLLIACANLGNLLLARMTARQREMGVRAALGASRLRLIRQVFTEALLLSLIGGALGVVIASGSLKPLLGLAGDDAVPRLQTVAMDARVLGFALGLSVLTAVLFSLAPALRASGAPAASAMREGGRGATESRRARRIRDFVVVGESALALALLAGAALLLNSFWRLRAVDAAFSGSDVVTFQISLPGTQYAEDHQRIAFYEQALTRLRGLPGVRSAGATLTLPLGGGARYWNTLEIEGRPAARRREDTPDVAFFQVTPGFLETVGIPITRGRGFEAGDRAGRPLVALINRTLADRFFPGGDAIGKRLRLGTGADDRWLTIVGIAGDVKIDRLDEPHPPAVYAAHAQGPKGSAGTMVVAIRSTSDPTSLLGMARAEIAALDRLLPLYDTVTLDHLRGEALAPARVYTVLLSIFAGLALALAAIGVYGVLSYSVAARTQEIGVRMALGARTGEVVGMILRQGLALIGAGVALGLGGVIAAKRVLSRLLYEVQPNDGITLLGAALVLALVGVAACYLPARRAARVDPVSALRAE